MHTHSGTSCKCKFSAASASLVQEANPNGVDTETVRASRENQVCIVSCKIELVAVSTMPKFQGPHLSIGREPQDAHVFIASLWPFGLWLVQSWLRLVPLSTVIGMMWESQREGPLSSRQSSALDSVSGHSP